jgi:hypothetical protein
LAAPAVIFALLLSAPSAFAVRVGRAQGRMINVVLAAPVIALALGALRAGVLDVRAAFAPAALCAVIAVLLGLALASRRLPGSLAAALAFLALFGGAYGYGAMIYADTRFDHAPDQQFLAQVERRGANGRVTLAPFGPLTQALSIQLSPANADAIDGGAAVCIDLHPGALRMAWYALAACATN